MNVMAMSLDQIQKAGMRVLLEELGPVGFVRFVQQYETGSGDYTQMRQEWLSGSTVREIALEIEQRRQDASLSQ